MSGSTFDVTITPTFTMLNAAVRHPHHPFSPNSNDEEKAGCDWEKGEAREEKNKSSSQLKAHDSTGVTSLIEFPILGTHQTAL